MDSLRSYTVGKVFKVYTVVSSSGRSQVERKLERYLKRNPEGFKKLDTLFLHIVDREQTAWPNGVCKKVRKNILEFRERDGLMRVFGFFDPHNPKAIILTKAWLKAGKNEQTEQIEEVQRQFEEYKMKPLPVEKKEN